MLNTAKRKVRRRPLSFTLEALEARTLMAVDVLASATAAPAALAAQQSTGVSFPRFGSEEFLRQELLEAAVERYQTMFGTTTYGYPLYDWADGAVLRFDNDVVVTSTSFSVRDHSTTNVQTAGVDEADIVKTDGNYIYFVDGNSLVILDTHAAAELQVVSRIDLHGTASNIYLDGDRLSVITQNAQWTYDNPIVVADAAAQPAAAPVLGGSTISVAVYDVSDRTEPTLLTRTDFEGTLVQSRMIDGNVYLVTRQSLNLPMPIAHPLNDSGQGGEGSQGIIVPGGPIVEVGYSSRLWIDRAGSPSQVYETEAEYRTRLTDQILDAALPKYTTYGAEGQFERGGRISNANNIYDRDLVNNSTLVSVLVFDATGEKTGPQSSTSVPAGNVSQIYASLDNLYVVESNYVEGMQVSDIYRFAFGNGCVELASIGEVPGSIVNQFSLDEYNGYLRVATQSGAGQSAHSAVYVLGIDALQMPIVGRLENLTPGENLYSTRFVGDRGFLVTFGPQGVQTRPEGTRINPVNWFDPLLAIDLSDPANPRLRGQLEVSGFSNYLQVVDGHYLVAFGRDANTQTGQWTDPQVSIFDIADLDRPTLVDRFIIPAGAAAQSDAFDDHHAISYFADQHILAIPINTSGYETVQDGLVTRTEFRTHSQMWVFKVDPTASDALQSLGTVDLHATLRRSVRIEDELYSIAGQIVQANRLEQPSDMLGQVYFGPLAFNSQFTVDRTNPTSTLNVLENFQLPGEIQQQLQITAVDAPQFGTVAIAEDGKSLRYTIPVDGTQRDDRISFAVKDAQGRSEHATATIHISWQSDAQRLLQRVKVDVANRLGVPVEQVLPGRPSTISFNGVTERIWTDQTLTNSYGPASEPTPGFEITVNYRGNVFVYHTDLADRVVAAEEDLLVGTDSFVVAENSSENVFEITGNDYEGVRQYKTPQLVSVSSGDHFGQARLSNDGTKIIYTPAANYIGYEHLTYKLANGEDGTITVRIPWDRLGGGAVDRALADLAEKVGLSVDAVRQLTTVTSIGVPQDAATIFGTAQAVGFEIHLNYAGNDVEYDVLASGGIRQVFAPRLVVRDEFSVAENSVGVTLSVKTNDFPNTYYSQAPFPIAAVSASAHGGQVEIGADYTIRYTPPAGFTGEDTCSYTAGGQTVPVSIHVYAATQQAAFQLVVKNHAGDSARHINVGDEMIVEVYAVDHRDGVRGLATADAQLLFDPALANLLSVDYAQGANGQIDGAGQLHIQYTAASSSLAQVLLATVRLRVEQDGVMTLATNSGPEGISLVGPSGTIVSGSPADASASVRLTKVVAMSSPAPVLDVNQDGAVSALDVLLLVNRMNSEKRGEIAPAAAPQDIAMRLGFGFRLGRAQSWDTDGNGRLDALDVLKVVNRLNEQNAARDNVFAGF